MSMDFTVYKQLLIPPVIPRRSPNADTSQEAAGMRRHRLQRRLPAKNRGH